MIVWRQRGVASLSGRPGLSLDGRRVIGMTGLRGRAIMGGWTWMAFVRDGFVAVRQAVDASTAAACRDLIWAAMERSGVRRDDPGSWPPLVGSLSDLTGELFVAAYLSPPLTAAYDELIGPGRWQRSVRPAGLGETVVVRFPAQGRANAGYHIEGSYRGPAGQDGWVNIRSRARRLLALFLFTDVGRDDALHSGCCAVRGLRLVPQYLAPTARGRYRLRRADFWRPFDAVRHDGRACRQPGRRWDVFAVAIRSWCTRRLGRTGAPDPG